MSSNIALKIAPSVRSAAPQAARHLVQRYWSILMLAIFASASFADEGRGNPFESVALKDEKIEAVLPASGPRWVAITNQGTTPAGGQMRFLLADGETLQLVDKHIHYRFVASVSAREKGLQVRYRFDARSFGDAPVERNYFIRAE